MKLWKINFTIDGKPLANIINAEDEQKAREAFISTARLNYTRLAEKPAVNICVTAVREV